MLERTAASLESCNLQRVLSKPARSSKRCRQLHTGFWQHGASAIELSSIWPAPVRAAQGEQEPVEVTTQPLQAGLLASTFLLDFLYPSGTYAYLKRFYPAFTRNENKPSGASRRRNFTSSTAVTDFDTNVAPFRCNQNADQGTGQPLGYSSQNESSIGSAHTSILDTRVPTAAPDSQRESVKSADYSLPRRKAYIGKLADLLSRPEEKAYHDVWNCYRKLDEPQKRDLRAHVVIYLSTSHGTTEINRAISVLGEIPVEQWDKNLQAVGVLLHLRAGDQTAAIRVFESGLMSNSCGAGFKYLLEYSFTHKEWPTVLKVWLGYYSHARKTNATSTSLFSDLPSLKSVPDLDKLYLSFERYLEAEAAGPVSAINLHQDTRQSLRELRRWVAQQVLRQPCSPKQAKIVLQIWNDKILYRTYLSLMVRRWNEGLESRGSLATLPDIYQHYRVMENVKPPRSLLRQMFHLYYPSDTEGLAQIYLDWREAWGDLDQWGYEKFLKFYATTGDVQAVKDLWARYTKLFPEASGSPQAFRSTMNVYAQLGDVAGAEHELQTMRDRYGVEPDIDTWNTLLKCYCKSDDQARVFQCFEEIKQVDTPDSFTYAQVMAMAAKIGDLTATLDFYNQSQKAGVQVSKEMAMSLVIVYCNNDRLLDAEKICVEFTERNITSTAVWNQLVYFNGLQGKLDKCYGLLKAMKNYGLEWDHQTHEYLLQALVQVDQVQSAYRLLQNARDSGLFPLGPEHYAVVISGAVRTGHLDLAETTLSDMRSAGLAVPFKAHVSFVEASFRRNPSAPRTRVLAQGLVDHLRSMLLPKSARAKSSGDDSPPWGSPIGLVELKRQTKDFGRAIMMLVELREFAAVEQLVTAYLDAFPEYRQKNYFPPQIASALMLGYLKDGKLDQVNEMWQRTYNAVLAGSTNRNGALYPAHRYDLARPLNVVAKAYREANDGAGLLSTVQQLTGAGFKLTRTNWNLCIRYLAEMGLWEQAMDWCEEWLMPRWRGWTPAVESLQERRDLKNTRILTPSKATVFSLQREWLKLRKLAAWSGEVSSKLKEIERRHPKLHYTFITTDYENLPATWVLPKKKSMTKAINEMLKPLSHDELLVMRKALEKQLRLEKQRKVRKVVRSPFHVVTGRSRSEGHIMTRAVKPADLKSLDSALEKELAVAVEREGASTSA